MPNSRAILLKSLRIASTALFGIATLLLIVLWTRRYRGESFISLRGHWIVSFYGKIFIDAWEPNPIGEGWRDLRKGLRVPYVLPVSIAAVCSLATFPWLDWSKRFSLRTLLIITTLVAIVLWLVHWLR